MAQTGNVRHGSATGAAILIGVGVFFLILKSMAQLPSMGVPRTLLAGAIDNSRGGKAVGLLCEP